MAITVSSPNNIKSPDGNALAVFKDATSGLLFVKDINGQTQNVDFNSTGSTLQQVLDTGNSAIQNMSVDGNIDFGNGNSFSTPSLDKFVVGTENTLNGTDFVIGKKNTSNGETTNGGYIIGSENTLGDLTTNPDSVIIGFGNSLRVQSVGTDGNSFQIGSSLSSTANVNYLIGRNITTTDDNRASFLIGESITLTNAVGDNNYGFGANLTFSGAGSSVTEHILGSHNLPFVRSGYSSRFRLGTGISSLNRENAIDVQKLNASPNTNLIVLNGRTEVTTGMVISTNGANVQVDDSSLVIGAGNNDIVEGSDHCLAVGNTVQILNNSDQSIVVGQAVTLSNSNNSMVIGRASQIYDSTSSATVGATNRIGNSATGFITNNSMAIGSSHIIETQSGTQGSLGFAFGHNHTIQNMTTNSMALGFGNSIVTVHRNSIMIGGALSGQTETMTMGFRNNVSEYPSAQTGIGLGTVKYVIAVGTTNTSNSNAMLITEGGQGSLIPRIIFPSVTNFNFTSDANASAGGIPVGGLYHNAGDLKIRLT